MLGKILQSTSVVGAMTLLSRISGLARDVVFANILGDSKAADVFFVAFRIPNFFRRLSGEGAFSAAFVPVFTEFRIAENETDARAFLSLTLGRFGAILIFASLVGVIFAPLLVGVLAPGFRADAAKFQSTIDTARIVFPYLFFISLVAMSAGMLNACGRFAAPAATPILLNVCLIFAAFFIAPFFARAEIALGVGVLLAGFAQLIFQLPFLRREKLLVRPTMQLRRTKNPVAARGAKKVFALIVPAIFGVSVAQVNVLINTLLASFMATGSIAWLYYSDRLMEFPVGVFGVALATTILPNLAKKFTARDADSFRRTLDWAMRWVVLICVPATLGLMLLAEAMVATIYYHGDFSANGVRMAAKSLVAFAFGLTAIVSVKILAPGFYARQNTKTPTRIGVIAVLINLVFVLLLFRPLAHVGLALATSLAAFANAAMLFIALSREKIYAPTRGWIKFFARIVFAGALMCAVLLQFRNLDWLALSALSRALYLCGIVFAGGAVYFLGLFAVGLRARHLQLDAQN